MQLSSEHTDSIKIMIDQQNLKNAAAYNKHRAGGLISGGTSTKNMVTQSHEIERTNSHQNSQTAFSRNSAASNISS